MKIMLVTRVWPTQRPGGMGHVCFDRAVEMARQGHEIHVVTTSRSPKAGAVREGESADEREVRVHYTAVPAHQWTPAFASELAVMAELLQPDVIHSESFDRGNLWWQRLRNRPPVAITMHGLGWGGWLTQWNQHRALGGKPAPFPEGAIQTEVAGLATADVVIGVSLWEQRVMRDQYGLPDAKLVYNPIDPAFFGDHSGKPKSYFLCAAVSGSSERGFDRAQRAARAAGVELRTIKDVSRSEMPALYDQAHAVVLPTAYAQGYDLTIAEGRARGVPAIMTPTGSYLDEAAPWDTLVRLGDDQGLERALRDFQRPTIPDSAADRHRPEAHVRAWLEAVTGG